MNKLTKSMRNSIEAIKKDTIKFFPIIKPGLSIFVTKKPTKKRIFLAKITNIGKPYFQLFIDRKLFGSYLYENEKWKETKE
jgi:hypothetical protein